MTINQTVNTNGYIHSKKAILSSPLTCLSCFIRASALFPTSSFLFFFRELGPRSPVLLVRLAFATGDLFVIDCRSCNRQEKD